MADTTTTNYGWVKPENNASADTWGTKTNTNWDGVDTTVKAVSVVANAALSKAGGTMTGKLLGVAPTTGGASFTAPHGTAPTSPVNGDLWTTTSGAFWYINGATKTVAFTDGNVATATKLATARTLALTGGVTGSGSFDGSADLSIATATNFGTTAGTSAQGNDSRITGAVQAANNGSDFSSISTTRTTLGIRVLTSGDNAISQAGQVIFNHNFGVIPCSVKLELVCQTGGDNQYSAGDVIVIVPDNSTIGIRTTSAVVVARFANSTGDFITYVDKTSGNFVTLSNAKWKLRITVIGIG